MSVLLSGKARTLERLAGKLEHAEVLPQHRFSAAEWRRGRERILAAVLAEPWGAGPLIARSSALAEDGRRTALAGHYASVAGVRGKEGLAAAIDRVAASLDDPQGRDEIFVQPWLERVALAGVAFTRDPNTGADYLVVNYDDKSGTTDAVTSGRSNELETWYRFRRSPVPAPEPLDRVVALADELIERLGEEALDFEFALTHDGRLVLLQVRPLTAATAAARPPGEQAAVLARVARRLLEWQRPHPYLYGDRTVFGVMPDWNPAEIIGIRPRPLALSLYRELVTDSIWAYQRHNYGYRNLRSFPLLVDIAGLPYVDVRVSFNSFLPATTAPDLARRLVNHYIDRLVANPDEHDKVEFEIIFSCYTFDLHERMRVLDEAGFTAGDRERLAEDLRDLTRRIIDHRNGLWLSDRRRLDELVKRREIILESDLDLPEKIFWLLEDCKRYGTLPFAGLARAAFIAVQMLRSLVTLGVLDESEYALFMESVETVGSRMARDLATLPRAAFLARYGHLRPGTYDILSPRYDEAPERYLCHTAPPPRATKRFTLDLGQLGRIEKLLSEHGLGKDVLGLFEFIRGAIEGREYAKFVFTRSLSDALVLLGRLAEHCGLDLEDASFVTIQAVQKAVSSCEDIAEALRASAEHGRRRYEMTRQIVLPPLIVDPREVWDFHLPPSEPNFITQKRAAGPVRFADAPPSELRGAILLLPRADPGFDWIFTHGIAGFVTAYGGINSHMAIRAGELGIPAVVGAGEKLYRRYAAARELEIDASARQVRILR
ncbi:MAG: phosphoenolpyruvate synthase [Acidobacteria bacterium]|nr:MAG: phosphoenolpyruvate synthase [Acidobacteriota bacterium]